MKRWRCPTCGSETLAPMKPRRDDVRRYCFKCSTKTGRLVERTCPALDKEREERKTKRVARTQSVREREREAEITKRTIGEYDLLLEAKRFAKLPEFEDLKVFPEITFRRTRGYKAFTSGHCHYGSLGQPARIVVTIGTDPHGAVETMLHEMVHALLGARTGHSAKFWSTLRSAAKSAWPDAPFQFMTVRNGWHTDAEISAALSRRDGRRGYRSE